MFNQGNQRREFRPKLPLTRGNVIRSIAKAKKQGGIVSFKNIHLCTGIKLDLSHLDLRNADFRGAHLDRIDLTDTLLEGANFQDASLYIIDNSLD